jgi:hypothetical protein
MSQFSKAIVEDPVEFIETVCVNKDGTPVVLHETQKTFLRGIGQGLTVGCCGRQWGKSVGLGGYGTWYAATHSNKGLWCVAPTVDQSRIIFNEIAHQFRTTALSALVVGKIKEYPFPNIRLKNGTEIHGRGANNPQFIRGKPGHRFLLDEASFFKKGVIRSTIEPMLTVTGKMQDSGIAAISTPFGMDDFYELCERARKAGHFYHYTSLDNPHADMEFLAEQRDYYGEDSLLWRSEYMAEFVDGDMAVFPWSDIKAAIDAHPYLDNPHAPEIGHKYVQGVDLANMRDFFVASVLDTTNASLNSLVRYDRAQKRGYPVYKGIVRSNYRAYNRAKTLVDATSMGESVAQDLADIGAEGYKFTGTTAKNEVVQELARMLSERRLTLPNDLTIVDELRYFQYEITPSKRLKMEASHGHDDIVMSLSLAAHLACLPSNIGFFRGVEVRPQAVKATPKRPSKYYDPIAEVFANQ